MLDCFGFVGQDLGVSLRADGFGEKGKLRKHFQELGKYQDKSNISFLIILSRYPVKCFSLLF